MLIHLNLQAIDEQYYGYKGENEIRVKTWKYQGRTPFEEGQR